MTAVSLEELIRRSGIDDPQVRSVGGTFVYIVVPRVRYTLVAEMRTEAYLIITLANNCTAGMLHVYLTAT